MFFALHMVSTAAKTGGGAALNAVAGAITDPNRDQMLAISLVFVVM